MKRRTFLVGLILLSLIGLVISSLPAPREVWQATFDVAINLDEQVVLPPVAGELRFSYPRWVRSGESATLQLTLSVGDKLPDSPLVWITRVEMPGARVQPDGLLQQACLPGAVSHFRWTVTPYQTLLQPATVWIYLQPAGEGMTGKPTLVASYPLTIQVVSFLPAGGWAILRIMAGIGLIFGLLSLGLLYKPRLS